MDIYKLTVQTSSSWTWSSSKTLGSSTGTTQSASVTIGGPSFGYTGPTDMAVYYDVLYQTFAFAPIQGALKTLHGIVTNQATKPARGQEVIAVANGITYRTITNAKGEYRFFERMTGPVDFTSAMSFVGCRKCKSIRAPIFACNKYQSALNCAPLIAAPPRACGPQKYPARLEKP